MQMSPLSTAAAHIEGSAHHIFEAGLWILIIFGCLTGSIAFGAPVVLCCGNSQACLGLFAVIYIFSVGSTVLLPLTADVIIKPGMQSRAWNSACNDWDMEAFLVASTNASAVVLGSATVILSKGNYSMQLVQNGTNVFSFFVVNSFNHTPPISSIHYNNKTLTFLTSNATYGNYTVDPQLSFP